MKTSLICTVLNEEATIKVFLDSIAKQTKNPDEIIIVDGGSTDKTLAVIAKSLKTFALVIPAQAGIQLNKGIKAKVLPIKIIRKNGNRSVGRNEAIKQAKNEIILSLDAGCIADKDWIKNITEPFKNTDQDFRSCHSRVGGNPTQQMHKSESHTNVDVVAGYYKGDAKNLFQKCLIPYVLTMPDKINPDNFLPAGRSLAFKKAIWKKVGGFNEKYSHNEDYVFAKDLKSIGAKIEFKKNAIVNWIPRDNLKQSFYMFFRFAYGDAEAKIFRPKVLLLFFRYITFFILLIINQIFFSYLILNTLYFILISYILWAITKNYKYVNNWQAFYYLPLIQFTADLAVMTGTFLGTIQLLNNDNR